MSLKIINNLKKYQSFYKLLNHKNNSSNIYNQSLYFKSTLNEKCLNNLYNHKNNNNSNKNGKLNNNNNNNNYHHNHQYKTFNYQSCGPSFVKLFNNLKLGHKIDVVYASIALMVAIIISIKWEKEDLNKCINSNEEFQKEFEQVIDWIEKEIEQSGGDFQAFNEIFIKELDIPNSNANKANSIMKTLEFTNIGHSQPQTKNNIERLLNILTEKVTRRGYTDLYFSLIRILRNLISDYDQKEIFIPSLVKMVKRFTYSIFEMQFVTMPLNEMARDKKYLQLLAENNVVSLLLECSSKESYALNEYIFSIHNIISNIDEDSDPNIDDKEKEIIKLCRQDNSHPFWTSRLNIDVLNMAAALLASIPVYRFPFTTISIPSIAGFGVFYGVHELYCQYLLYWKGFDIKTDSPLTRIFKDSIITFLGLVSLISFRNFPFLLKPYLGFFIGKGILMSTLNKKNPYDNAARIVTSGKSRGENKS